MPSSLISRVPLAQVFAGVPDPRARRGVRHDLPVVLTVAAAAVLAGARSLLAISEWTADVDRDTLSQLGIDPGVRLPSESTIRRTLAAVDPDDLDARIGAWMATRVRKVDERTVISVDGKYLRGATYRGAMPHLLAALDHRAGVVLGQRAVPAGGSEITTVPDLLAGMDLTGVVVTADALHCQRETATWLTGRGAHYALTVKANQPGLLAALKKLPWADVPRHTTHDRRHGRRVTRTIRAVEVPDWVDWPGAAQVLQVRRTRKVKGHNSIEVVYVVTSVPMLDAQPRTLASWIQGHWCVENSLHWVRDVTFDEDRHQLRVGNGPHVMATLRNTAIGLLRLKGWTSITAGLRHHARHPHKVITLMTST